MVPWRRRRETSSSSQLFPAPVSALIIQGYFCSHPYRSSTFPMRCGFVFNTSYQALIAWLYPIPVGLYAPSSTPSFSARSLSVSHLYRRGLASMRSQSPPCHSLCILCASCAVHTKKLFGLHWPLFLHFIDSFGGSSTSAASY